MAILPPYKFDLSPFKSFFSGLTSPATPQKPAAPIAPTNVYTPPSAPAPNMSIAPQAPAIPNMSVASPTTPATPAAPTSSIVDYLSSVGQANDFMTRSKLAAQYGIQNYAGTAEQNTQLLNTLRSGGAATPAKSFNVPAVPSAPGTITTPSGLTVNPATGGIVNPPILPAPPVPVVPQPPQPSVTQTAQQDAEKAYHAAIGLSPEEISSQEAINKLVESTQSAYRGEAERPIALPFITGRQAAIERRAIALAEPIQAKAALAQARRVSALEASKFALERADKAAATERETIKETQQIEMKSRQQVLNVAENLLTSGATQEQINQIANAKTVEEAMEIAARTGLLKPTEDGGFTLSEGQVRYDAQGNVVAGNVGSEGLSGGFGGEGYVVEENPTVDSWVNLINNGQSTIANVPTNLKNAVANALTAGGSNNTDAVKVQILQDKIDTINGLINHRGMSKSVGPTGLARWTPFKIDTWTGDVQDFVGGVHQLTAKETLDYLVNLKKQGGTLGALNQSELDILKESASKINSWEIKDENNNPSGKWNISESKFKAELETLKILTTRALQRATGGAGEQTKQYQLPDGTIVTLQSDGTYR